MFFKVLRGIYVFIVYIVLFCGVMCYKISALSIKC